MRCVPLGIALNVSAAHDLCQVPMFRYSVGGSLCFMEQCVTVVDGHVVH